MKKTKKENIEISQYIEKVLGITFKNEEFNLGNWGHVDNSCELINNKIILLECEGGQDHPCTNVLKLWPYLEEFSKKEVILIHYFFPRNDAPKNRVALCHFLGEKLENIFGKRFRYVHIKCEKEVIARELKKHDRHLMQMLPNWKKLTSNK